MESSSGALKEITNGSSQLSAGRAGQWCEVEKCGFLVPSPRWGPEGGGARVCLAWAQEWVGMEDGVD